MLRYHLQPSLSAAQPYSCSCAVTITCANIVWFHAGQVVRLQKSGAPYGIIEGEEGEYLASLTESPSEDVHVEIKNEDERSIVKTSQLIFTPANWSELQKIIIVGRDDDVIEDTPYYTKIQFIISSTNESLNSNVTVPLPIIDADNGK